MKTLTTLLFFSLVSSSLFSQNFSWVEGWGGPSYDYGNSIATDAGGNVYTTGVFQGTVDFDASQAVANLTSAEQDIFITKTNSYGKLLWVKQIGGSTYDATSSIAIDDDGNVYISGLFQGIVDFDPGAGTFTMNENGDGRTFICKLDTDGDFIWAKQFGGVANATAIAVDADHNVYATGNFDGIGDFDPGTGVANLDGDVTSLFVSKFNESGDYVWARHFLRNDVDTLSAYCQSIAVDGDGNVYTTGGFEDTVDFDPGTGVYELNPVSPASMDIFISKLDQDGNFVWAKTFGSVDYDRGLSLVLDGDANIYTVGLFSNIVDFDGSSAVSTLTSGFYNGPTSWYSANLYISKYDTDGNFIWTKGMVGPGEISGTSIALDSDGEIYTAGYFNMTIDLDPGPGVQNVTTTGVNYAHDIFAAKLDVNGDLIWAKKVGGTYHDRVYDLAVDANENMYMTGIFEGTVDFYPGGGVWYMTSTTAFSETPDVFLMKLSSCMPTESTETIVAPCNEPYTWAANGEVYQSGNLYHYVLPNADGCDSIISLDLDIPVLVVEYENIDGTLTYTNPQPNETYQWVDCYNNMIVPGATESSFTPLQTASYVLIVTSGDCVDPSDCILFTFVGLDEINAVNIRLYPNPAHDAFTIAVDNDSQLLSVEATAVNGQLVFSDQNPESSFSVSAWETGVYLVKVVTEKGSHTFRVVKD